MLTKTQKEQVLKFISAHTSKTFTFRDLVRSLDIGSDDRRSLDRHLDGLDKEGVIRRIKRNCYSVAAREDLVAGTVHCHRDGYGFLLPEDRRRYREDIFIPARNMEDALHEDRVLVKIEKKRMPPKRGHRARRRPTDDDRKRIEGRVVRVLERKKPVVVGRYCAHPRFPFVVPLDNRIPHNIRIPFEANRGAEDGSIVAVTLTLPPSGNQSPQGSITKVLGYPGDPDIEYRIVEHTHGLPVEFTPASLQEAQGIPNRVIRKECDGREDFREETIITIDNDTARDFDDAVGIRKLPSGNYILGVHIADVSHYVAEGSALDAEAFARGTSVYFPDRNIPMLPPRLSSGICSLKPDVDRLVFSAIMEVTPGGDVARKTFTEGVIRSRARMTYTSVAAILEKKDEAERARFPDLTPMLETMQELCAILAAKRKRRGAIDFDLPEAEFQFDRKGAVVSVTPARRTIAHRIIEEFMLLANESVAETLAASGGPAIYRVHEKPDTAKAEDFAEFARCLGYTLNKSGGLYAPGDFQKFIARIEGRTEQKFLVYLMLRSFMQARYSESNIGHFGLATPEYTHFTAPIRRYPDLIVHRLLKRCFDKKASPQWREDMAGRLPEIARHSSARERAAEEAEREIEKIKKAQFMAGKVGEEFEALVYSPSRNGFFVELMDPFVEGFVPVETLTDDHYVYREKSRAIMGRHRGRRFQPGSKIRVRLDRADTETARLTFSVCAGR